jgi:integrase
MARTVKDALLATRTARASLPVRKKPHYRLILQGFHLGYYRGTRTGSWSARRFIGQGRYEESKLGAADDIADADGVAILSFAQAQERAREWFSARAKADAGHEEPIPPYIVAAALDDYERDYVRRGGKAVDRLRYAINGHIRPEFGPIELDKLSRRKIEGWLENLAGTPARLRSRKGQAPRHREQDDSPEGIRRRRETANRILTVLKAALNLAYQHGKIQAKVAWEPVKPYRDVGAPKIRYLNDPDCKRLIDACEVPFRNLVIGALLTGARYGELASMRATDFDPDNGTIHIPRSKSGKARHVFLTPEGQQIFVAVANNKRPDDCLFARSNGEAWGNSHQVRHMREACETAAIEPPISFHILRHTYASRLAMRGVPLNVIAAQLGHSDTRMTEKHYAHLAPSYVGETIRAAFGSMGILEANEVA